mmetsp:Transcript_12643/g.46214  ORF Transcript_12643/g.46214 Transcript_12643/m.46214 type:complete len:368 (+) Transcript_12643:144-1247(+)
MFPRVACEEGAPRIPEDCPNMSSSADPCPFLQKLSYMSSVLPIGHVPVQPDGTREELMELASRCPVVRQVHGPEGTHPLISKDSSGQGAGPQATHVPSLQFASISSSIFGHVPGYSGDNDAPSKVPERRDFELSHTPEVPVRQPKTAPIDVSNVQEAGRIGIFKADSKCPVAKLQRALNSMIGDSWTSSLSRAIAQRVPSYLKQCPRPIVQIRARFAQTAPVRALRPKAVHTKLASVGAVSATANLPCGAVREHFEKFSPMWFVAVHASIPFVMLLRKAVVLPPYAISVTILSAIIGQIIGSRAERARCVELQRMAEEAEQQRRDSGMESTGEESSSTWSESGSGGQAADDGLLPLPPRPMAASYLA